MLNDGADLWGGLPQVLSLQQTRGFLKTPEDDDEEDETDLPNAGAVDGDDWETMSQLDHRTSMDDFLVRMVEDGLNETLVLTDMDDCFDPSPTLHAAAGDALGITEVIPQAGLESAVRVANDQGMAAFPRAEYEEPPAYLLHNQQPHPTNAITQSPSHHPMAPLTPSLPITLLPPMPSSEQDPGVSPLLRTQHQQVFNRPSTYRHRSRQTFPDTGALNFHHPPMLLLQQHHQQHGALKMPMPTPIQIPCVYPPPNYMHQQPIPLPPPFPFAISSSMPPFVNILPCGASAFPTIRIVPTEQTTHHAQMVRPHNMRDPEIVQSGRKANLSASRGGGAAPHQPKVGNGGCGGANRRRKAGAGGGNNSGGGYRPRPPTVEIVEMGGGGENPSGRGSPVKRRVGAPVTGSAAVAAEATGVEVQKGLDIAANGSAAAIRGVKGERDDDSFVAGGPCSDSDLGTGAPLKTQTDTHSSAELPEKVSYRVTKTNCITNEELTPLSVLGFRQISSNYDGTYTIVKTGPGRHIFPEPLVFMHKGRNGLMYKRKEIFHPAPPPPNSEDKKLAGDNHGQRHKSKLNGDPKTQKPSEQFNGKSIEIQNQNLGGHSNLQQQQQQSSDSLPTPSHKHEAVSESAIGL